MISPAADGGRDLRLLLTILAGVALGAAAVAVQGLVKASSPGYWPTVAWLFWVASVLAVILTYLSTLFGSKPLRNDTDLPLTASLVGTSSLASRPARRGQQRSLRRMRQVLMWVLARSPGPRRRAWGAVGVFLGLGLVAAFVRGDHVFACWVVAVVALVTPGDEAGVAQGGEDVPAPRGGGVVGAAGQLAGYPQDRAVWGGGDLQVHPVHLVFTGIERAVGGDSIDRDERAVKPRRGSSTSTSD
jgi:hypothetical protein